MHENLPNIPIIPEFLPVSFDFTVTNFTKYSMHLDYNDISSNFEGKCYLVNNINQFGRLL